MRSHDLRRQIESGALLSDGAMGTQLMAAGLPSGACGERWNLEHPERIEQIHRRYIDAGARLVTTNTFGGTAAALARHGLADRVREVNEAGARCARSAAGEEAWVMGDIGPFGGFLEPVGDTSPEELRAMFTDQAIALQAGGADAIIVETMADPQELSLAVQAASDVADWPVLATYAFDRAGEAYHTMMGTSVDDAVKAAIAAGADAVGANCGTSLSLEDYLRLAKQLVQAAGDVPVILQPNAGAPALINGELHYRARPSDMAALAPKLLDAGVRILGGCCGTTPEHIAAMAPVVCPV